MKAIFVAGTDTGVGKTIVTGLLARHFLEKGYRVATQKWVETGSVKFSRDIDSHLKLMKRSRADYDGHLDSMMPYIFKFAASPHLACRMEGRSVKIDRIKRSLDELSKHFDVVIIEGCGGLMVPVGEKTLQIDVVRKMRLPVLLVAGNRLGAINSTLLSIEALKTRGMNCIGVVFNESEKGGNSLILKDNPKIVKKMTKIPVVGSLPYMKDRELLYKRFERMLEKWYSPHLGKPLSGDSPYFS